MAQINKSSDYFNTKLYTGNATVRSITGVGFQPDWTWIKRRSGADNHYLFDAVRGVLNFLQSNDTSAENTRASSLTSFDSDGFSLGTHGDVNSSGQTFASWSWLGGNGTASNTDGSITSTVSANTTSGFSIVSWTGNGTHPSTIGHGLGSTPKMIITKPRSTTGAWHSYHVAIGNGAEIYLDKNNAQSNNTTWNSTTPTSSVFTVGNNDVNTSGTTYIAYCFAEKKGFSKFGSYTGNGSTDGTFIYTGFKPAMVILKITSGASNWRIVDNKRDGYNPQNNPLLPNATDTETTTPIVDLYSNGFKLRTTDTALNGSGNSHIYMAFAESPLVGTNNIPAVAR